MPIDDFQNNRAVTGLLVADNVSAMLAYWDKNLVSRFANDAYLKWFGKAKEEIVGEIAMKDILGPIFEANKPYIEGVLSGKKQHFERTFSMPDGSGVRYAQVEFNPHVVNGEVVGFSVHSTDITAVKKLELQLENSNSTINIQNKSLLNFANIVTHNLRAYANNLGMLMSMFESEKDPIEQQQLYAFMKEISSGFSNTVENLSDVVKAQNLGSVPLQKVNLHAYIHKVKEILRNEINTTGATITDSVGEDIFIEANPAYIESIILNFITNAIKYRHPERPPAIALSSLVVGRETVFYIRDNGIGIDLERHRHSLYGMYKTFHGNKDATGIGLFITKYQIDSMGGHIGVESTVGKGTEFRVYFKTNATNTL